MIFETVEIKPEDEIGIINNLDKILTIPNREDVIIEEYVILDAEYDMRLDKLIKAYYGGLDDMDIICDFNGLNNALEAKEGDIMMLPNIDSLKANVKYVSPKQISVNGRGSVTNTAAINMSVYSKPEPFTNKIPESNVVSSKSGKDGRKYIKTKQGILIL